MIIDVLELIKSALDWDYWARTRVCRLGITQSTKVAVIRIALSALANNRLFMSFSLRRSFDCY